MANLNINTHPFLKWATAYYKRFGVVPPRSLSLKVSLGEMSREEHAEILKAAIETGIAIPQAEAEAEPGILD